MSIRSTRSDSLPSTRAPTWSRRSTPPASGRSAAAATAQSAATSARRRTTQRANGPASEPAIFPERAVAAGGDVGVAALADRATDLAHAVAVPELGDRRVADVADDDLAPPVVDAHQHLAIVEDARHRERDRTVAHVAARRAPLHALEPGELL